MITETETAFLAVVRAFLTEEKAALEELAALTEKQWNHLFVMAAQHSLLSAVYDVVGKTPEFAGLPGELRGQVKTQAMQSILQQVSRTALFLSDEKELEHLGVQPLVMKGIVCRNLYPKPDLRPSGDEDLLIPEKDFAAVDACFMRKGFVRDKETAMPDGIKDGDVPEEMGYIHPKTGAFYEIHTRLFSTESSAYGYLNRAFSDVFAHPSKVEVQGQSIFTLEETHHLFYLLCHSFKHFLHGGVGIRQICDMVQMIRIYGRKIDWEMFWQLCDCFSMILLYQSAGYRRAVSGLDLSAAVPQKNIFTLEETHHLFYLLCHSFKHFLHGGVGIRQICDMVQMIRIYGRKIDWEMFWQLCEEYHMTCFCINLLDIGERYLGFSYEASGAVRAAKKLRPDSEALLIDILDAGSFGKSSAGRIHSANITLYAAETGAEKHTAGGNLEIVGSGSFLYEKQVSLCGEVSVFAPGCLCAADSEMAGAGRQRAEIEY